MHTVQIYLVQLYYHRGIYTVGAIDLILEVCLLCFLKHCVKIKSKEQQHKELILLLHFVISILAVFTFWIDRNHRLPACPYKEVTD